jgi:hypothetical protein
MNIAWWHRFSAPTAFLADGGDRVLGARAGDLLQCQAVFFGPDEVVQSPGLLAA